MNPDITFVNHPMRRILTAQQVAYWKLNLARVLKIGAEFEFNLPDQATGNCRGVSFTCNCTHYGSPDRDCWTQCVNHKDCSLIPATSRCKNRKTDCIEPLCQDCSTYEFQCVGIACSNRVAPCIDCSDFKMNCLECAFRFDPSKNPDAIRQACINQFRPSGSYGVVSTSGVHNITTDGSLLGKKGMEIITTGRRVDYWEFYKMTKDIIDTSVARGGYSNERCSIHMHGLAGYYGKIANMPGPSSTINELEKSVPEIILANLHQLFRRYQNAITWMTSGLDTPEHLTRWEKFRVSILPISAITQTMPKVVEEVSRHSGGNKYSWANYKFCGFDNNGDVNRLHIEVRVMDGILAPSAVAAVACLYYSLFIKAVELSRYGIMDIGNADRKAKTFEIKDALLNNCTDWQEGTKNGRFSDTSKIQKYTDVLVRESLELITLVKHIIETVGPAYDVLEKLAEAPCSIRRCEGKSWETIEKELLVELTDEDQFEYHVKRIIDTREVTNKVSIHSWIQSVANKLNSIDELNPNKNSIDEMIDKVSILVEEKMADGNMLWGKKIGSMMNI